jgi:hypothetical protein
LEERIRNGQVFEQQFHNGFAEMMQEKAKKWQLSSRWNAHWTLTFLSSFFLNSSLPSKCYCLLISFKWKNKGFFSSSTKFSILLWAKWVYRVVKVNLIECNIIYCILGRNGSVQKQPRTTGKL